jgi:hypothetical protein
MSRAVFMSTFRCFNGHTTAAALSNGPLPFVDTSMYTRYYYCYNSSVKANGKNEQIAYHSMTATNHSFFGGAFGHI